MWAFFKNLSRIFKYHWSLTESNRYFTWRPAHICDTIQVRSKDSQVKTQLVLWISILFKVTRWRHLVTLNKINIHNTNIDDWLTVHHIITLVDLQLDVQNSCLFTYNTFIKILYMFPASPCSSSGGLRRNCIYAASGIVTLCRWLLLCTG